MPPTLPDSFHIRLATVDDAPLLVHHRRAMFEDIGCSDVAALDAMDAAFGPWVRDHIQRGEYRAWLMVNGDGEVIAGADLWVADWPPGPTDATPYKGCVYNVYTHPDYRHRGFARCLMQELIDWCRTQPFKTVSLHASNAGRPLYESLGFKPTNEMRLWLGD